MTDSTTTELKQGTASRRRALAPALRDELLGARGGPGLSPPAAQADGTKRGRLDGLPDSQAHRVPSGLEAGLWALPVLPSVPRACCRAAAPPAHGLLETVAVRPHHSPCTAQVGDGQANGHSPRAAASGAVALVTAPRAANGQDHAGAHGNAGARLDPCPGACPSLSDLTRRVRTRRLGGVGRAVSHGRPYPIRGCRPTSPVMTPPVFPCQITAPTHLSSASTSSTIGCLCLSSATESHNNWPPA